MSHELACDHDHQRDDPEKNEINADQRKAVLWLRLHHPMMCSQAECRGDGELKLSKRFKVDVVGVRRAVSMTKRNSGALNDSARSPGLSEFGEHDNCGHADDRQDEHEIEEVLHGSTVCVILYANVLA